MEEDYAVSDVPQVPLSSLGNELKHSQDPSSTHCLTIGAGWPSVCVSYGRMKPRDAPFERLHFPSSLQLSLDRILHEG